MVIVCPVLTLTFHGLQCMFAPGVHVRVRELKIIVSSTCKALKSAIVMSAQHTPPFIESFHSKCLNRYQFTSPQFLRMEMGHAKEWVPDHANSIASAPQQFLL